MWVVEGWESGTGRFRCREASLAFSNDYCTGCWMPFFAFIPEVNTIACMNTLNVINVILKLLTFLTVFLTSIPTFVLGRQEPLLFLQQLEGFVTSTSFHAWKSSDATTVFDFSLKLKLKITLYITVVFVVLVCSSAPKWLKHQFIQF